MEMYANVVICNSPNVEVLLTVLILKICEHETKELYKLSKNKSWFSISSQAPRGTAQEY